MLTKNKRALARAIGITVLCYVIICLLCLFSRHDSWQATLFLIVLLGSILRVLSGIFVPKLYKWSDLETTVYEGTYSYDNYGSIKNLTGKITRSAKMFYFFSMDGDIPEMKRRRIKDVKYIKDKDGNYLYYDIDLLNGEPHGSPFGPFPEFVSGFFG